MEVKVLIFILQACNPTILSTMPATPLLQHFDATSINDTYHMIQHPRIRSRWELFREYRDSFIAISNVRQPLIDESSFERTPSLSSWSRNNASQKNSQSSHTSVYPW